MANKSKLKRQFKATVKAVAELVSISPSELTRNAYIRISVDTGLEGRLNKEELNDLGGYSTLRDEFFPSVKEIPYQPKILIYDIETAPMVGYFWGLWDQNIGLGQILSDWHVLSWSAKWLGDSEDQVMYMDQRNAKKIEDDKRILKGIWKLLDEADIVITQNGKRFDQKKLNARFIEHGMQPPSSYRHIDTLQIAKRTFAFTSNKLAYMTDKFCTKYKKLKHAKFSGFSLWKECLAGNLEAWEEMELYNRYDVLSLEELYLKLAPWDNSINFEVYTGVTTCKCGHDEKKKSGYHYTNAGKFQKHRCTFCGFETRGYKNLLDTETKKRIARRITPSH